MKSNLILLQLAFFLFVAIPFNGNAQVCNFTYSLGGDTSFCPGAPINFNLTAPSANAPFLWDNGSTAAIRNVSNFGTYYCRATEIGADVVSNGNFNSGSTGFTSDYTVGTGGTWGPISVEGTYLVTTDANLAHTNFQHFTDHTGAGNMMVVNGSGTPNQSVWCQTINVSQNTDYNFSAWVANCVVPVPLLQFSINGVTLGAVFSPPTTVGLWTKFSANWNSGTNANAVICIVNQNTNVAGNDFALDDIFFQPICTFTDTVHVTSKPLPTLVDAGSDTSLCIGNSVQLSANAGTGTSFAWSSIPSGFSATVLDPSVSPLVNTSYIFSSTLNGCTKKDTVFVKANTLPNADIIITTVDSSCSSYAVELSSISTNATTYYWEFGDGLSSNDSSVIHSYAASGNYTVLLTAKNTACADTQSVPLKVIFSGADFTLPNVFTPNGDASNENFFVPKECIQSASVSIYNRWGVLVKKWEGLDGFWDGKIKGNAAADGVYYYVVDASYANGETTHQYGTISLYR